MIKFKQLLLRKDVLMQTQVNLPPIVHKEYCICGWVFKNSERFFKKSTIILCSNLYESLCKEIESAINKIQWKDNFLNVQIYVSNTDGTNSSKVINNLQSRIKYPHFNKPVTLNIDSDTIGYWSNTNMFIRVLLSEEKYELYIFNGNWNYMCERLLYTLNFMQGLLIEQVNSLRMGYCYKKYLI